MIINRLGRVHGYNQYGRNSNDKGSIIISVEFGKHVGEKDTKARPFRPYTAAALRPSKPLKQTLSPGQRRCVSANDATEGFDFDIPGTRLDKPWARLDKPPTRLDRTGTTYCSNNCTVPGLPTASDNAIGSVHKPGLNHKTPWKEERARESVPSANLRFFKGENKPQTAMVFEKTISSLGLKYSFTCDIPKLARNANDEMPLQSSKRYTMGTRDTIRPTTPPVYKMESPKSRGWATIVAHPAETRRPPGAYVNRGRRESPCLTPDGEHQVSPVSVYERLQGEYKINPPEKMTEAVAKTKDEHVKNSDQRLPKSMSKTRSKERTTAIDQGMKLVPVPPGADKPKRVGSRTVRIDTAKALEEMSNNAKATDSAVSEWINNSAAVTSDRGVLGKRKLSFHVDDCNSPERPATPRCTPEPTTSDPKSHENVAIEAKEDQAAVKHDDRSLNATDTKKTSSYIWRDLTWREVWNNLKPPHTVSQAEPPGIVNYYSMERNAIPSILHAGNARNDLPSRSMIKDTKDYRNEPKDVQRVQSPVVKSDNSSKPVRKLRCSEYRLTQRTVRVQPGDTRADEGKTMFGYEPISKSVSYPDLDSENYINTFEACLKKESTTKACPRVGGQDLMEEDLLFS